MIQIKSKEVLCEHTKYCQHRKLDKCQLEQERMISHTFQPKNTFSLSNHPVSRSNHYKSNIPTLAYEKYLENDLTIDEDEVKGDGVRRVADYLNIIEITQELMKPGNAYNLAQQETADFELRKKLEREKIIRAKKRAQEQLRKKLEEQKALEDADKLSQKQFLQRLVKKLNAVADHIILRGGQSTGARQRQLLQEKGYLNVNYIAELKIKDRNAALGILDDLRVLLLKHKVKNQQKREDIQHQKKSLSSINRSGSMLNSSMVSDPGTLERELKREEAFLDRFCNFEALQKKWLKESVQQVKDAVRRVLATRILAHAQREVVKNKKQKKSLDKRAIREMSPPYQKTIQELDKKGKLSTHHQSDYQAKFIEGGDMWPPGLNATEMRVKSDWVKANQGSSAGQMLRRELDYVRLFQARARDCCIQYQMKEDDAQVTQCSCDCHCSQRRGKRPAKCSNL